MKWSKGYKIQLKADQVYQTSLRPPQDIITQFIVLRTDGRLTALSGYACDGASRPAVNTKVMVHGAVLHDCLYQLARLMLIPWSDWRKYDNELKVAVLSKSSEISWISHKFWKVRITWVMAALWVAGGSAARPKNRRKVYSI